MSVSCGTGGNPGDLDPYDASGSFTCTFPDGPANPVVSVQATDNDGDSGNTDTQTVHVNNVAPTVAFTTAPASANEGETKTYTYSISDPGQDTVAIGGHELWQDGSLSNESHTNRRSFDCKFLDGT